MNLYLIFCRFILVSLGLFLVTTAWAADNASLSVRNAWARPLPPVVPNGAVYMTVVNNGAAPARLTRMSGNVSKGIEIHRTVEENGIMKMQRQNAGVMISPGETVTFAPNGLHVMLVNLVEPLREGQTFPLMLHFESGRAVEVTVSVQREAPQ